MEPLLLLAMCLLVITPESLLTADAAIGAPTRDLFDHLALLDAWALSVSDWNYPEGGSLVPPDLFGMILAAPWLGLSRSLAYNIATLLQLWLACMGAWALGRRFGSGLVCGVAYGLSPFLIGQLMSGEAETLSAWPLPVMVLLLLSARRRAWAGAGAVGAIGALGSWYYGAFMAVIVGLWVIVRGRWWSTEREPGVLVAPAVFAGLIAAPAIVYARVLAAPDQLFRGPTMATYLAEQPRALAAMSSDPMAWLGTQAPGASGHVDTFPWLVLGLAAVGIWSWRDQETESPVWWWIGLTVLALALSVGPVLHLRGAPITALTPYRLLMEIPPLGLMRLPHRWMLVATLGAAVLAARGALLMPRLFAGFVFLETLWFVAPPVFTTDTTPPEVVARITGPVLELPTRTLGQDARGRYLLWQRTHRQPTPYALLMQGWSPQLAAEPLVIAVAAQDTQDRIWEQAVEAKQFRQEAFAEAVAAWRAEPDLALLSSSRQRLTALGFSQIILHLSMLQEDDARNIRVLTTEVLGEPEEVGDALLWELVDE